MGSWSPPAGPPQFLAPYGPPPAPAPPPPISTPAAMVPPPQRPAVVATAATLAVTASLQWICVLAFAWLVAVAALDNLRVEGTEGAIYHLFNRFHGRMLDGLAWPLFGFPLASFCTGFLLLAQRPGIRLLHTLVGFGALGWSAWWLHTNLVWWLVPATYVLISCLILWTPAATRWYRWGRHASASADWPGRVS